MATQSELRGKCAAVVLFQGIRRLCAYGAHGRLAFCPWGRGSIIIVDDCERGAKTKIEHVEYVVWR